MPEDVPFLAQRHLACGHKLTPRVRSTVRQKRTPSSATETGIRPVDTDGDTDRESEDREEEDSSREAGNSGG